MWGDRTGSQIEHLAAVFCPRRLVKPKDGGGSAWDEQSQTGNRFSTPRCPQATGGLPGWGCRLRVTCADASFAERERVTPPQTTDITTTFLTAMVTKSTTSF